MSIVPPSVLSVLELFKGPLAGMRFADVDADGLSSLLASVEAAGVEVTAAEVQLAELQQALAVQQEALLALAQRALAYARVYAESHDELLNELNGISMPRPAKPRKASAPKFPDPPSAEGSVQAPAASASAGDERAPHAAAAEGRAIEFDSGPSEASEASEAPAMPVSSARKSRRTRAAISDSQADEDTRASASE